MKKLLITLAAGLFAVSSVSAFPSEHYDFTSGYNLSTISRIWITYNGNHNLSLNWK